MKLYKEESQTGILVRVIRGSVTITKWYPPIASSEISDDLKITVLLLPLVLSFKYGDKASDNSHDQPWVESDFHDAIQDTDPSVRKIANWAPTGGFC